MAGQLNVDRIEDLARYLETRKGPIPSSVASKARGVYALRLDDDAYRILGLHPGRGGVAYAGVAGGAGGLSRRFREEWRPAHSGRSSPRRTLGALLEEHLDLTPQPRPPGNSSRDCDFYCFGSTGEAALTAWLDEHAQYSWAELDISQWPGVARVEDIERQLIGALRPPLNLTKWANPDAKWLGATRAKARSLAALKLREFEVDDE